MNVQEYIASGILESYALDQLSDKERVEVEQMIQDYPEVEAELVEIEHSLEEMTMRLAVKPSEGVKSRILSDLQGEASVIPIRSNSFGYLKYAAAASLVLALFSMILAFNYWNKWKSAEAELSELITQNQQFAQNYNRVNQELDDIGKALLIMNDKDFRRIALKGTDNAPDASVNVFWNTSTEDVYLSVINLKQLAEGQQYQLWAIIDGVPVDAGVFDLDDSSYLVQMKGTPSNAAAFAITIEPRGGSENPALETMQVLGNT